VTALLQPKMSLTERWTYHLFPLAVGNKAWNNGMCGIDLSTGKVEPAHVESDLFIIGRFAEDMDATLGEKQVNVNLGMELEVEWWANDTGAPVTAAMVGSLCYAHDDQTVSSDGSGKSIAGRVWLVDAVKGVAVQKLDSLPAAVGSLDSLEAVTTALAAFSSNNIDLGINPNSNALYDVPTTAAASTVTLPATATDGTILYFTADGTKNAHTVTYRDATGPVNLTPALAAAKRHLVICVRKGAIWVANAFVSP
jgi:hypothetical protein